MAKRGKKKTLPSRQENTVVKCKVVSDEEDHPSSMPGENAVRRHDPALNSPRRICPETIKGTDDMGRFYNCHDELLSFQKDNCDELYHANSLWWANGGYNGSSDEQAMIGDAGGEEDAEEGLAFLDRFLAIDMTTTNHDKETEDSSPQQNRRRTCRFDHAVDLGAGVGRVTKLLLLKRYGEVRLVEADEGWSKRSRVYLGRKRASRCSFSNQRVRYHCHVFDHSCSFALYLQQLESNTRPRVLKVS